MFIFYIIICNYKQNILRGVPLYKLILIFNLIRLSGLYYSLYKHNKNPYRLSQTQSYTNNLQSLK